MNVHLEGVSFPAAQFLDGEVRAAIDVQGHCTPSSEGVAADVGFFVVKEAEQSSIVGSLFNSGVDVVGRDVLPSNVEGVGVTVDGHCLVIVSGGHDVVHPAGQGFDGAVVGLGAVNMHYLSFGAVLLVGDADGGIHSLVEGRERGVIGDVFTLGISESDAVD